AWRMEPDGALLQLAARAQHPRPRPLHRVSEEAQGRFFASSAASLHNGPCQRLHGPHWGPIHQKILADPIPTKSSHLTTIARDSCPASQRNPSSKPAVWRRWVSLPLNPSYEARNPRGCETSSIPGTGSSGCSPGLISSIGV